MEEIAENSKNGGFLEVVYVVTKTSIYKLTYENGYGVATKIALRENSHIRVGMRLQGGTMISIGQQLVAFVPDAHSLASVQESFKRELGDVVLWGDNSSYIVGIFLSKKPAEQCLDQSDLKPCDPRWLEDTREALKAIGDQHPGFSICKTPKLALGCIT